MASPAQVRSHVAPPPQLTEHSPVQVIWQIELPLHVTLPLLPTVSAQVEPPVQSALHDSPQAPLQLALSAHLREQLLSSQVLPVRSQVVLAGQLQLDPLQVGGFPEESPPQWARTKRREKEAKSVRIFIRRCYPASRRRSMDFTAAP